MKNLVILVTSIAMFLLFAGTALAHHNANHTQGGGGDNNPTPIGGGHDPVTFCHKPGTPAEQQLTSDDDGFVQGHLGHGDTLGPCPVTPPPVDVCPDDLNPGVQTGDVVCITPPPVDVCPDDLNPGVQEAGTVCKVPVIDTPVTDTPVTDTPVIDTPVVTPDIVTDTPTVDGEMPDMVEPPTADDSTDGPTTVPADGGTNVPAAGTPLPMTGVSLWVLVLVGAAAIGGGIYMHRNANKLGGGTHDNDMTNVEDSSAFDVPSLDDK